MSGPAVHTVPQGDDGWANELEGSQLVFATFDTRDEAVAAGRDTAMATKVEHIVMNADGTICERHSYDNDAHQEVGGTPRLTPG